MFHGYKIYNNISFATRRKKYYFLNRKLQTKFVSAKKRNVDKMRYFIEYWLHVISYSVDSLYNIFIAVTRNMNWVLLYKCLLNFIIFETFFVKVRKLKEILILFAIFLRKSLRTLTYSPLTSFTFRDQWYVGLKFKRPVTVSHQT